MPAQENKATIQRIFEQAWNRGDFAVADEAIGAGVLHSPAASDVKGPDGFKQYVSGVRRAFSDLKITIQDQVAEGDKVATRWTVTGTHDGAFMGIAPTGKKVSVAGMTIDSFSDGKLSESWNNWDALGLMRQIGAIG